jgi:hypothetical protein
MNKFRKYMMLSVFAFGVFLLSPRLGYADTMTVTLESVGGQQSGSEYVYPYNFSFNGSATLTPLMCISFTKQISIGESWTATLVPISGNKTYVEAAYIFSLAAAPGASAKTIAEAQWANWEFFDPGNQNLLNSVPNGYQSDITSLLNRAALFAQNNVNTKIYSDLNVFIPVNGTQSWGGTPQTLIGDPLPQAPEPGSLLLMGSGLLGLAGLLYRRSLAVRVLA